MDVTRGGAGDYRGADVNGSEGLVAGVWKPLNAQIEQHQILLAIHLQDVSLAALSKRGGQMGNLVRE